MVVVWRARAAGGDVIVVKASAGHNDVERRRGADHAAICSSSGDKKNIFRD